LAAAHYQSPRAQSDATNADLASLEDCGCWIAKGWRLCSAELCRLAEYQHSPVALPFEAKSLKGISEKLIQSHWENNYGGAIKALNTAWDSVAKRM
jgi:hypothetical protein